MATKKVTEVEAPAKKLEISEFTSVEAFKAWRAKLPPAEQNSKAVTTAGEKLIAKLQKG